MTEYQAPAFWELYSSFTENLGGVKKKFGMESGKRRGETYEKI